MQDQPRPFALAAQIITFSASNQNQATVGFELNEYDWMLNPVYYRLLDKTTLTSLAYTNTYSDAATATESTLTSRGDRTDTTISLRNSTANANALALEGDVALTFGSVATCISLGTGLLNWDFTAPLSTQVVTKYSSGLDPTIRDQETVTEYSGAY